MNSKRTDARNIWITLAILLFIAGYHLSILTDQFLQDYFGELTDLPVLHIILSVLYAWLLLLLLVFYRRWKVDRGLDPSVLGLIHDEMLEALLEVGPDRLIRYASDSVQDIFGYTAAELVGRTTVLLYGDRRQDPEQPREIYDLLKTAGCHIGSTVGIRKDHTKVPLEIITLEKKGAAGALLVIRDLASRRTDH